MKIVYVTPDDWQSLRNIRLKALGDCPDAFSATFEEEQGKTENDWRNLLSSQDWRTFVAFIDDQPVGMACGGTLNGQKGLFAMWVDPQFRRRSVAKTLVQTVIE